MKEYAGGRQMARMIPVDGDETNKASPKKHLPLSNARPLLPYGPLRLPEADTFQDRYILTTCRTVFRQMGHDSTCFAHSTQEHTWPQS